MAASSPFDVISTVAAGLAAGSAVLALISVRRAQARAGGRRLELLKGPAIDTDDPLAVRTFLLDKAGPLTLEQYRDDPDVRRVVDAAIGNAEVLTERLGRDGVAQDQESTALELIRNRAYVEGFARIRLAIELQLRRIAATHGLVSERQGTRQLLYVLGSRDERVAALAPDLADILGTANAAVHGSDVNEGAAGWVIATAPTALRALRGIT